MDSAAVTVPTEVRQVGAEGAVAAEIGLGEGGAAVVSAMASRPEFILAGPEFILAGLEVTALG